MRHGADFSRKLDRLIEALHRDRRIDAPTQAALSRASGVREDTLSRARKKLTFSTTNKLALWESLGVQPKYWTEDVHVDVMRFVDTKAACGPPRSGSTAPGGRGDGSCPVAIPVAPETIKLKMLELTISRRDPPAVQLALLHAEPPAGRGNDLLWWFQLYDDARDRARSRDSASETAPIVPMSASIPKSNGAHAEK